MQVTFASVTAFKDLVGTATTLRTSRGLWSLFRGSFFSPRLDLTPPNLTLLDVAATEDSTRHTNEAHFGHRVQSTVIPSRTESWFLCRWTKLARCGHDPSWLLWRVARRNMTG